MRIVRTLVSADKLWRGEIFQRDSKTFGFRAYRWHEEEVIGGHWDVLGGISEAITASADDAERELRARVPHLADAAAAV